MYKCFSLVLIGFLACMMLACEPKSQSAESLPPTKEAVALQAKQQLMHRIDSIEALIKKQIKMTQNPDVQVAFDAYNLYDKFTIAYISDSLAPVYLFKMAQLQGGIFENPEKSSELYQRIWENYPKYKQRPISLFFAANAMHDSGDTTAAIELFNKFIRYHRFHLFVDDAEGMVKMLSMNKKELDAFLGKEKPVKK